MTNAAALLPPLLSPLAPLHAVLVKVVREQRSGKDGDGQGAPDDVLHQRRMRLPQFVQAAHFTSALADASRFANQVVDHGQ